MAKYAFNVWETSKYQIIFDADSREHARQILNATRNLDELPNASQKWIKGNEDWDVALLEEVDEDGKPTKESNNE